MLTKTGHYQDLFSKQVRVWKRTVKLHHNYSYWNVFVVKSTLSYVSNVQVRRTWRWKETWRSLKRWNRNWGRKSQRRRSRLSVISSSQVSAKNLAIGKKRTLEEGGFTKSLCFSYASYHKFHQNWLVIIGMIMFIMMTMRIMIKVIIIPHFLAMYGYFRGVLA